MANLGLSWRLPDGQPKTGPTRIPERTIDYERSMKMLLIANEPLPHTQTCFCLIWESIQQPDRGVHLSERALSWKPEVNITLTESTPKKGPHPSFLIQYVLFSFFFSHCSFNGLCVQFLWFPWRQVSFVLQQRSTVRPLAYHLPTLALLKHIQYINKLCILTLLLLTHLFLICDIALGRYLSTILYCQI